jgi:hypothetical protein
MELSNTKVYEYNLITDKIVFADGISRTGKAMLSNLLLGYENISSIQFINPFEQLMPMYINGKITKDAMSGFLKLFFNENIYNYKLSRNINFRYDDLTSIYNTHNPKEFFKNLSKEDGDSVVKELENSNIHFQYQTHDLLTHYSKFLELNIDAILIELFRNPIDTIHSWYKRGWGTRFDNIDPRSGTTLFEYNNKTIPHYAIGKEEYYLGLNPMEKCVFMHNSLQRKSINEYQKLTTLEKKNILLIRYEDILEDPVFETDRIANFLDLKKIPHMQQMMIDAKVPRTINHSKKDSKSKEIASMVSQELFADLVHLSTDYEQNFYNLKD